MSRPCPGTAPPTAGQVNAGCNAAQIALTVHQFREQRGLAVRSLDEELT